MLGLLEHVSLVREVAVSFHLGAAWHRAAIAMSE